MESSSSWVMKINVDAAFSANTGKGSIGAVVRDEERRFHAAGAWFLESVASVMVAEAEACRRGDMGVRRIVVETDSKLLLICGNLDQLTGQR
jgi:ribonuclease HI